MSFAEVVPHLRPAHAEEMPPLVTTTKPPCRLIKALANVGTRKIIQKEGIMMKIALEATLRVLTQLCMNTRFKDSLFVNLVYTIHFTNLSHRS